MRRVGPRRDACAGFGPPEGARNNEERHYDLARVDPGGRNDEKRHDVRAHIDLDGRNDEELRYDLAYDVPDGRNDDAVNGRREALQQGQAVRQHLHQRERRLPQVGGRTVR